MINRNSGLLFVLKEEDGIQVEENMGSGIIFYSTMYLETGTEFYILTN